MTLSPSDSQPAPAAESTAGVVRREGPPARLLPWLLFLGGAVGFVSAFVLAVERYKLLTDPSYKPSCTINSVLSCGSVMTTPQAAAFGFPNPFLGIAGFAIVVTVGVVALTGARLPRWFWLGLQTGTTLGVVFIHWLIYQTVENIGYLCPYCMIVWAVTIPIFWYTTVHNLVEGHLPTPRPLHVLVRYHAVVVAAWALFITGIVVTRFLPAS